MKNPDEAAARAMIAEVQQQLVGMSTRCANVVGEMARMKMDMAKMQEALETQSKEIERLNGEKTGSKRRTN